MMERVDRLQAKIRETLAKSPPSDELAEKSVEQLLEELHIYYQELEYQNDELLRVQEELKLSEIRYKKLYEDAPVAYVTYSESGDIQQGNGAFWDLVGGFVEDAKMQIFIHPDDQDLLYFHLSGLKNGGADLDCKIRVLAGGESVPVHISSNIVENADSNLIRSALTDLSKEEILYEKLCQSERRLSSLLHYSYDVILVLDRRGNVSFEGGATEQIFGYEAGLMVGKDLFPLVHNDDRERIEKAFFALAGGDFGALATEEFRFKRRDGELVWLEVRAQNYLLEPSVKGIIVNCRDITERVSQREQLLTINRDLKNYQDRLNAVMLAGNIAWWQMDVNTGSVVFNANKVYMLGRDPYDFKHYTDFTSIVHEKDLPPIMEAMLDCIEGRASSYDCSYRISHKDGSWIWFHDIGIITSRSDAGEPMTISGVAINCTDQKLYESSLKEAKAAAEALTEAKSEFIAHMSHEIRTPLNGIIGFADVLSKSSLDDQQKTHVNHIVTSGKVLLDIVNDILDLSKIEAGKMELEVSSVTLSRFLSDVLGLVSFGAEEKGLDLRIECSEYLPEKVFTDALRLRQILVNLLGNAIKFTDRGFVVLDVSSIDEGADGVWLKFVVRDSGIGISKENQARLFDAFMQADCSTTRRYGGTGLGLVIANLLTEKMGGELSVESDLGCGSTFTVCLPFSLSHTPDGDSLPVDIEKERVSYPSFAPHILVAEDNFTNSALLELLLRDILPNAVVDLVETGKQALETHHSLIPHMVFMDVHMPEMDGLESTREILKFENELGGVDRTPIVALTAGVQADEKEGCIDAGMCDFISKPISPAQIFDAIEKYLLSRRGQMIIFSEEEFLVRVLGRRDAGRRVLKFFLEDSLVLLNEAEHAFKRGDYPTVREILHRIKGAASNVSALALSSYASHGETRFVLGKYRDYSLSVLRKQYNIFRDTLEKLDWI